MERIPTILIPASLKADDSPDSTAQQSCSTDRKPVPPMGYHPKPPKGRSESQFERDL